MGVFWGVFLRSGLFLVCLLLPFTCFGGGMEQQGVSRADFEELKERLERLEAIVSSQQQVIQEQKSIIQEQEEKLMGISQDVAATGKEGSEMSWSDRIEIGGLVEFGGGWENREGKGGKHHAQSDLTLATVEVSLSAEPNDWVRAESVLLYEDSLFEGDDHNNFDVDVAVVTLGNTDEFPLYLAAGKMYLPFGALLTNFPDDPLTDIPVTVLLGEISEKAVLVGFERSGLTASAYLFNGDLEKGDEDHIEDYGFDIHYKGMFVPGGNVTYGRGGKFEHELEGVFDYLIGTSYISNIAESDGLTDRVGTTSIHKSVPGIDFYLHIEYGNLFLDAEYMGAIEDFDERDLKWGNDGAQPAVWNFEAGFNYNWWRNLVVAFKYAGSDEAPGMPEARYGICFNQEIYDGVIASLGYTHDEFNKNADEDLEGEPLDKKDFIFWQLAVEF